MSLDSITQGIREEIAKLSQVLRLLDGARETKVNSKAPRREMSVAGKSRIAAAQRARWAKVRGQAKPKRKLSSAGRARIAAAQKARWAKIRAAKR